MGILLKLRTYFWNIAYIFHIANISHMLFLNITNIIEV